jgi:uncharacterized membrane protein YcaP (DUF421 family)
MQSVVDTVFGHGKDLNALQMGCRALVLFFVALVLVRIAGMRAFGRRSSFDTVILVGLGAVMTRAIYGASPAIQIIAASAVLVVLHRVVGMLTAVSPALERLVKGRAQVVFRDGKMNDDVMHVTGISGADLDEAARSKAGAPSKQDVREIWLEADGELTVL